jgi:hypothetical protein
MPPTVIDYNLPAGAPATRAPKRRDPCADPAPACPACGGLKCLCRPRFFPGQLLTDEDLNRLQNYVIEKNRLRARYLHGWGVACGLEVVCDPCAPTRVVVRSGYALSPCGDDIVVCDDQSVDVCELINRCRPQTDPVCDAPYNRPPRDCRNDEERWVLSICYDERPSRGLTAMTGSTDSPCSPGCSCGGCGSSKTTPEPAKKKKAYAPQCEPTQVCEGYRFVARKLPPESKGRTPGAPAANTGSMDLLFAWMYANRAKFGPLLERLLCCVSAALELRASFNRGDVKYPTPGQAYQAYQEYRDALLDFARDFAVHNCAFLAKVAAAATDSDRRMGEIRGAAAMESAHHAVVLDSMGQLDATLFELIAECFCSALLPGCPEPAADNCVPLAVVKVRSRDCRVLEICNWEERKLLITWTTVGYWLSWLPWHKLRESIAQLCCADSRQRNALFPLILVVGLVLSRSRTKPDSQAAGAAAAFRSAPAGGGEAFGAALRSENLVEHLAGAYQRLASGAEADAPEWASLIARFAEGNALAPLAGREAQKRADVGELQAHLGVEALAQRVADLEQTLGTYREAMEGLKNIATRRG